MIEHNCDAARGLVRTVHVAKKDEEPVLFALEWLAELILDLDDEAVCWPDLPAKRPSIYPMRLL